MFIVAWVPWPCTELSFTHLTDILVADSRITIVSKNAQFLPSWSLESNREG